MASKAIIHFQNSFSLILDSKVVYERLLGRVGVQKQKQMQVEEYLHLASG